MSTKTMRLPPRRVMNKRKEREADQPPAPAKVPAPDTTSDAAAPPSNLLLAGYWAQEFLSNGTLFGKPWPNPTRTGGSGSAKKGEEEEAEPKMKKVRYVEVCDLLMGDSGTHLPGIVNPTQLANFLQL